MSRAAVPGREEPELLAAPGLVAAITVVTIALTAGVFAAVGDHGALASIQRLDDAWLRLMISGRTTPLTAIAEVFNLLGLVYVTLPVRIAVAAFLIWRRRWWALAVFVTAIALSELLIGLLKGAYGRPRPPVSLVATTGTSFPSGHAIAASVTAVAAIIALAPAGRRGWWAAAAVAFSILMGLSRAYLGAHWLSDAVAGILLGTSCALLATLVVGELQRRYVSRPPPAVTQPRVDAVAPDRAERRRGPA
jgi:undecaprenyl-diphosphatase